VCNEKSEEYTKKFFSGDFHFKTTIRPVVELSLVQEMELPATPCTLSTRFTETTSKGISGFTFCWGLLNATFLVVGVCFVVVWEIRDAARQTESRISTDSKLNLHDLMIPQIDLVRNLSRAEPRITWLT
jgi:hypothetical protein